MKLSIVATLYQSATTIREFCARAKITANQVAKDDYEIILVNDGSPDNSLEIAISLAENDHHLIIVDLSRNFGHHKAMMTGLAHTCGKIIFLIDSDLEEDPEWLIDFYRQMEKAQCDVIYGVQKKRKGGILEKWSGEIFYWLFHKLTGLDLPSNVVVARLMTRRYVDALLQHRETELFLAGLWVITGFHQKPIIISKRSIGTSTYTLRKKISLFINSVTSFSSIPLVSIFFIGFIILIVSGLYVAYLVANWLLLEKPPSGYTSLMASVWILGGLITALLGVVGIYLSKIFTEIKQRPYTIVRQIFQKNLEDRL